MSQVRVTAAPVADFARHSAVSQPTRAAAIAAGALAVVLGSTAAVSPKVSGPNQKSEWPVPYKPDHDPTGSCPNPGWPQRAMAVEAGRKLALLMLTQADSAEIYRSRALEGRQKNAENMPNFRQIIKGAYDKGDYKSFNSNDFANVHHVAWILLGRALASLTNQNPHGDWGEPANNGSVHFEDGRGPLVAPNNRNYHFVPNKTGYYAISTADRGLSAPNLGV